MGQLPQGNSELEKHLFMRLHMFKCLYQTRMGSCYGV